MYFWKINELVEQIRSGALTEKSKFIYLMIYVMLVVVALEISVYIPTESFNNWDIASSVLYIFITGIGLYLCYTANGGNSGDDFLGKYFSIVFVVSVRALVFFIPVFIGLFFYWVFGEHEGIGTSVTELIVLVAFDIFVYFKVYEYIKRTNS